MSDTPSVPPKYTTADSGCLFCDDEKCSCCCCDCEGWSGGLCHIPVIEEQLKSIKESFPHVYSMFVRHGRVGVNNRPNRGPRNPDGSTSQ